MRARLLLTTIVIALGLVAGPTLSPTLSLAGTASAAATTNPWLDMRVMNMAHSGGENEAPMNTMYAFKRAASIGADMLELDVHSTKDGRLVVIHDATVDRTTNGTGKVRDLTLAQVQALDAGYWFVPGRSAVHDLPESSYPLRGARTGTVTVDGYAADDFRIPTLDEVFAAFPDTPINIEIKGTSDVDLLSFLRTGNLLATFLKAHPRDDVIVASFNDVALATFHLQAPKVGLAPGLVHMAAYFLLGVPLPPGTVALQIPVNYNGLHLATREFVERAHRDGYAVHIWFSGSAPDDAATYDAMIDTCADALMPARPTVFEAVLDERGIERPGQPGVDPCG